MLHRNGLVVSEAPGQGKQLLRRRAEKRRQQILAQMPNLLSMRFRGIDPERILQWMEPRTRWMFSRTAAMCAIALVLAALLLITVQFRVFNSRLPTFHQFFTASNAVWLMVILAVTKVIHEFGHGVACKHFGGQCHEMGFMLLLFMPCLYCNVSDSWMLPSKWHRALIGAAGMIVEVVLASAATFVWWFSEPGLVNQLALGVMFVSSVSTLVFNGNPLMRYDGYYILSDLVEVPNLSAKATTLTRQLAGHWLLGLESPSDPFLPEHHREWYVGYAIASTVYRTVVLFSALLFLNEMFKPYHLEVIGRTLGFVSLYALIGMPLWGLAKFFNVPGRTDLVDRERFTWSASWTAVLLLAFFFLPLPHRVYGTLELEAHDAATIYTEVAGLLREVCVQPGQHVEPGAVLGKLDNVDVRLAVEELQGRRDQYRSQLLSLRHQRFEDETAGLQLPEVQKSLAAVEQQLEKMKQDEARLTLTAPVAGIVMPAAEVPERPSVEGDLVSWSGDPMAPKNLGCFMTAQDQFCLVGDPRNMHALVVVEQSDVGFLAVGQTVDVKLDALPGRTLHGVIHEISSADVKISPRHLSSKTGGELQTKTDAGGYERPLTTSYHVLVWPLEGGDDELRIGLRGRARIHAPWQPVGMRIWRWFSRTFHFRL